MERRQRDFYWRRIDEVESPQEDNAKDSHSGGGESGRSPRSNLAGMMEVTRVFRTYPRSGKRKAEGGYEVKTIQRKGKKVSPPARESIKDWSD
jgi:hypothetical protein